MGRGLTDETETRLWQVWPFKNGVEDILSFTVQLVHLIQDEEPAEERQAEFLLLLYTASLTNIRFF